MNGSIEITSNTKNVDEEEYEKYRKKMGAQTILMSINGTIGNLAYFNNEKVMKQWNHVADLLKRDFRGSYPNDWFESLLDCYDEEIKRLKEALSIYQKYNRLNNDLDDYLFEIGKWGLDEVSQKPNPKDYGIE